MRLGVEAALVDGTFVAGDVEVEDGRIARCGLGGTGGRGLAVPGFVDLQVNGFGGIDFLEADAAGYRQAGDALLETGVTAYLPTLITSPEDKVLAALAEVPADSEYPRILGVHLEGPFLSAVRLGTHDGSSRRDPDLELLDRLLEGGPVRLMTLAPELPGALPLIEHLLGRGIVVSLGHSDATADQANAAFDLGVRTVTHLFNAMRPFLHRDPGIVGAALARDDVIVQMILDGVHLASETVKVVWRAAPGRVALVTDAITAAGASDGAYSFASLDVQVHDGAVRGPDGVLAGSVLTMIEAVRNLHGLGVPLAEAVDAATTVPARVLGLPELGRLDVGLPADIVILDDNVEIDRVLVGGRVHVAV
ncbi:MAG TPA: N-acetylglucosamine-6-phosphate deacetylase [Gaiellaceae bacterium]|jgi:N-acetylglucosamine-6-phosphate deacetylase|nr:N-acetylglucosamine-6-phosphate deacetylase [Gaiellaceae bacterium]